MHVSAAYFVMFISAAAAQKWRLKQQTSDWNFHIVRKHVNTSNILQSVKQVSLIGCTDLCSNFDGIIVPSLFFNEEIGECTCNSAKDETSVDKNEPEIIYGIRAQLNKVQLSDDLNKRTIVWPYQHDCDSVNDKLNAEDGVYVITPHGGKETDTWCDMDNGGWTVILRRMDGSENFYRNWNDYVTGFGNKRGEYWIGLETLHLLTKNGSQLMVYMEQKGVAPSSMTAHYSDFKIGAVDSNYRLYVSGFNGTCGNSFRVENEQQFTTFDNENDEHPYRNCANVNKGAWWYKACYTSHLTGKYYKDGKYTFTSEIGTGIRWTSCWAVEFSSTYAVMKIRRQS